jgi:hypothetical protein
LKQWVQKTHNAEGLAALNDFGEIKTFVGKIGTSHYLTSKNTRLTFGTG